MEKLKSTIPNSLKRKIAESTADDLPSTCSSLQEFLHSLPLFHQMIDDLTSPGTGLCRKDRDVAMEHKRKGNECFSAGAYSDAVGFYSQALRVAPGDSVEKENNLVVVLYVNRAASFHKMGLHMECLRDCKRALAINPRYAKAWYRRGNANTSLENFEDAARDLKMAATMEHSSKGKKQIERELNIVLGQHKAGKFLVDKYNDMDDSVHDRMPQVKLQCLSSPVAGRGMTSSDDIPEASLIHCEEPYAAIILKNFRETHCHFCLNELPADTVPCLFCTIPLYCSENCRLQASGLEIGKCFINDAAFDGVPGDLLDFFSADTSENLSTSSLSFHEHQHECQGAHWPSVLPSDIVLAGRILMKSMKQADHIREESTVIENLQLCHHYIQLPPEEKLQLHVYSIVLINCLQLCKNSTSQFIGENISKVVILTSQIKVNSMAIVRIKSVDVRQPLNPPETMSRVVGASTCIVEQVRVGEAIYSTGSLFNHSCLPNIHAYFLSRTLLIRATEHVSRGTPLELSYGPQVGQWDCVQRQQFLQDKYSFKCSCRGCSETNLPDLVLNAFRCFKPTCSGVVLDCSVQEYEMNKCRYLHGTSEICSEPKLQGSLALKQSVDDINKVASRLLKQSSCKPAYCLNCNVSCDLRSLSASADEAERDIRSLQEEIGAGKVQTGSISTAIKSLEVLRLTLHPYNKKVAELVLFDLCGLLQVESFRKNRQWLMVRGKRFRARGDGRDHVRGSTFLNWWLGFRDTKREKMNSVTEDIVAQAFCLTGELLPALGHCITSIKILEKLYNPRHIVIGNELVKLASLQLSLGNVGASDTITKLTGIYSKYYGKHADAIFPHLRCLKLEASKIH